MWLVIVIAAVVEKPAQQKGQPMHSLIPIFYVFGAMGVFSVGALVGAGITESAEKKQYNRPPLMELADPGTGVAGLEVPR